MPNFTDFQPFSASAGALAVEKAVQAFFVAADGSCFAAPLNEDDLLREAWTAGPDNIAFYTNFNELVNQQCRPRVKIRLHSVSHIRDCYALDANNNLRPKAWRGSMDFGIVTETKYQLHTDLRSMVSAIIPQMLGAITADGSTFSSTGINALLENFQVTEFWERNVTTDIVPADGAYMSLIPVELAFSVNPAKWPAGMITV